MTTPQRGACNVYYEKISGEDDDLHSLCGIQKGFHAHVSLSPAIENIEILRQMETKILETLGKQSQQLGTELEAKIVKQSQQLEAKIEQQNQQLGTEFQLMKSTVTFVEQKVTPSNACKTIAATIFQRLLEILQLPVTMTFIGANNICLEGNEDDNCQYTHFPWIWRGRLEESSYDPLIEYLKGIGLNAFDVHAGEGLALGSLFNSAVNSLKTSASRPQVVMYVKGRSDILVADKKLQHLSEYSRCRVRFCIEVKSVDAMNSKNVNECLREAIIQMIGLNVDNFYCSPSVLLTNLNKQNFVLYLDKPSNDYSPGGSLIMKILTFNSFHQALWFCDNLSNRDCVTVKWGSPSTPLISPVGSDEDTKEVDEIYESVDIYEKNVNQNTLLEDDIDLNLESIRIIENENLENEYSMHYSSTKDKVSENIQNTKSSR